jgi:hypothetical protein
MLMRISAWCGGITSPAEAHCGWVKPAACASVSLSRSKERQLPVEKSSY